MMERWRPVRDERGQGVVTLILVVLVVVVAVVFLTRTLLLGLSIDDKAEKIANTGRGINTSTDAILQLDQTQGLGQSIQQSTDPLQAKSDIIVGQAASIDGTATSINNSANSISSSASSIGSSVSSIQGLARLVDRDAAFINRNVRSVLGTAVGIDGDLDRVIETLAVTEAQGDRIADVLCLESVLGIVRLC